MRFRRLTAMAVATAVATTTMLAGQAANAASRADGPDTDGCLKEGETGLYLSREGEATVTFSPELMGQLEAANVEAEAIAPHEMRGSDEMWLPIGEKYDNIELPSGYVCYPGGLTWTNPSTGGSYEVNDFWFQFTPFGRTSRMFAYPTINGTKSQRPVDIANFSTPKGVADMKLTVGAAETNVQFYSTRQFADGLNRALGTGYRGGDPWASVKIRWEGAPTRSLVMPNDPALAGLRMFTDAMKPALQG